VSAPEGGSLHPPHKATKFLSSSVRRPRADVLRRERCAQARAAATSKAAGGTQKTGSGPPRRKDPSDEQALLVWVRGDAYQKPLAFAEERPPPPADEQGSVGPPRCRGVSPDAGSAAVVETRW
jgi:hypothetical protein